ncbi:hypothetical protein DE167_000438 [Clostridium beijerinckii]|uniref:Uncharacterized protein n=1 Tax=Clostridium beijerinckii TaxID=1520 RepID=A0AAX0B681_CLOBE|nr:hypothetical protein [Clostridium beijerinckii]NYC69972.1 hypothetical protein [Clostridium beijerinckii]
MACVAVIEFLYLIGLHWVNSFIIITNVSHYYHHILNKFLNYFLNYFLKFIEKGFKECYTKFKENKYWVPIFLKANRHACIIRLLIEGIFIDMINMNKN